MGHGGRVQLFKMAALAKIIRSGSCLARSANAGARTISVTAVSRKGTKMNDPIDHATGLEKYELLAEQAGNDDPFFMKSQERGPGTKEDPNIIDAMDVFRMIGCVCHSDDTNVKWMWLYKDQPKRCQCGYWFKLGVTRHHSRMSSPFK